MRIPSFNAVATQAQNWVSDSAKYVKKQLPSASQVIRNTQAIALPAIALVFLTSVSQVSATPFTDCIEACTRNVPEDVMRLLCYTLCLFV